MKFGKAVSLPSLLLGCSLSPSLSLPLHRYPFRSILSLAHHEYPLKCSIHCGPRIIVCSVITCIIRSQTPNANVLLSLSHSFCLSVFYFYPRLRTSNALNKIQQNMRGRRSFVFHLPYISDYRNI